jgi:hypothetical protein
MIYKIIKISQIIKIKIRFKNIWNKIINRLMIFMLIN